MMKGWLIIFALQLIPSLAIAQASIYELLDFQPTRIAHLSNVPEEFRIFVRDPESQILINPARARTYGKRFFYVHRDPGQLSFSYLSNDWLINLKTSISSIRDERFSQTMNPSIPSVSLSRRQIQQDEIVNDGTIAQVSFENFGATSYGASFIGFFALVRFSNVKILHNDETRSISENVSQEQLVQTLSFRSQTTDTRIRQSGYQVGATFGLTGRNWDFTGRAAMAIPSETRHFQSHDEEEVVRTTTQNGQTSTQLLNSGQGTSNSSIRQTPTTLNLDLYFRKQTTPDNSYFVSAGIAKGLDSRIESELQRISEIRPTVGSGLTEPLVFQKEDDASQTGENLFARLGAGYVITKQLHPRLYGFTGLMAEAAYGKSRTSVDDRLRSSPIDPVLLTETDESKTVLVSLPIYFTYHVTKWLDLFTIYRYDYLWQKDVLRRVPTHEMSSVYSLDSDRTILSDSQEIDIGISLRTTTGLVAHIDFNGILDEVRQWQVSVGYHF